MVRSRPMDTLPPDIAATLARVAAVDPSAADRLEQTLSRVIRVASALSWSRARLGRLVRAGSAQAVLDALVAEAVELTGAPEVWAVSWSGGRRRTFEALAGHSTSNALPRTEDGTLLTPAGLSRSIIARCIDDGRPAWSDDAASDARFQGAASVHALSLRSVGAVPLGDAGVLYLYDPVSPGRFTATSRARIAALCALASEVLAALVVPEAPRTRAPEVPGLVGEAPAMAALFRTIEAFAPMPWPCLVLGETGTGKEAVARALHLLAARRDAPFIAVNCGSIPDELAESQLFGHERGAFTGADRRHIGLVEDARDGTLFLDEVGELSARVQVKLLRLLQEGTWSRLGDARERRFAGRIVAATHRDVGAGAAGFREDLYHRLSACVVRVPPLRDRASDVPLLARHLLTRNLAQLPGGHSLRLTADAEAALAARPWPGNVRELENVVRTSIARALIAGATVIDAATLAAAPVPPAPVETSATPDLDNTDLATATTRFQQARVRHALEAEGDSRTRAATRLGVSRQWLHRLIAKWDREGPW
ncbi:MAG: DNA-binding NtrC family response regulator [Myxococcota bacterium]|jgi:DNA-binding NtrC family response regulator